MIQKKCIALIAASVLQLQFAHSQAVDEIFGLKWGDSAVVVRTKMLSKAGLSEFTVKLTGPLEFTSDTLDGSQQFRFRVVQTSESVRPSTTNLPLVLVFQDGILAEEKVSSWELYVGQRGLFAIRVTVKKNIYVNSDVGYIGEEYERLDLTPLDRQVEKPVSSREGELAWLQTSDVRCMIGSLRSML
jgi:hypothetical protein